MIYRVPKEGGFAVSGRLSAVVFASKDKKISWDFAITEEIVAEKGEWVEVGIDDGLMVCRLCAELDGVKVSRTLKGQWTCTTIEIEPGAKLTIEVGTP